MRPRCQTKPSLPLCRPATRIHAVGVAAGGGDRGHPGGRAAAADAAGGLRPTTLYRPDRGHRSGVRASLAVANNDNYHITFDLNNNQYVLTHSGANAALNTLAKTPFSSPGDPATQHIVDLDNLPHAGPTVRLAAVATTGTTTQSVGNVEFGPLGQTISCRSHHDLADGGRRQRPEIHDRWSSTP